MKGIKRVEFENGLNLLMERRPYTKEAVILVGTRTGSIDENKENSGITHFVEHMLFRTNRWKTTPKIKEELESAGADIGAETSQVHMVFYAKTLPAEIPKTLQIIYQAVVNDRYLDEEFLNEKENILSEIKLCIEHPLNYAYDNLFLPTLFKGTPLEKPIAGTVESVSKITKEELIDFKKRFCIPELVVVAGKFDEQGLIKNVEKTFGKLPSKNTPKLSLKMPLETEGVRKFEENKEIDQTYLNLGFRVPGLYHRDVFKLRLIQGILTEGLSSRLFKKLRDERGIGYGIDSSLEGFNEIGDFHFVVTILDPRRIEEVEEVIKGEFRNLKTNSVREKELKRAKNLILRRYYDGLEHIENRASQILIREFQNVRCDFRKLDYYLERLSPRSIREAANQYLTDDYTLTALVPGT